VINIFTSQSSSPFSFNLTNFRNPPSTQPIGNFIFQTYNATTNPAVIDFSYNNTLSGITPSPILSPAIILSQYEQGQSVEANLTVTITNVVSTTDLFYFSSPSEIDLSKVNKVVIEGVTADIVSTSSNLLLFKTKFELKDWMMLLDLVHMNIISN
jgi:hypothetical protein